MPAVPRPQFRGSKKKEEKKGLPSGSMTMSAIAPKGIGLGIFTGLDRANLHVAHDLNFAWPKRPGNSQSG